MVVKFEPVRADEKPVFDDKLPPWHGLDTFHHTKLERDERGNITGLRCCKFSGYGDEGGVLHSLESLLNGVWDPATSAAAETPAMPDFICKVVGADSLAEAPAGGAAGQGNFQDRKATALGARQAAGTTAMADRLEKELEARRAVGLFPCGERLSQTRSLCCFVYSTAKGLRLHEEKETG